MVVRRHDGRRFRLSEEAGRLVQAMDGQRSVSELAAHLSTPGGRTRTAGDIARVIAEVLEPAGLVARPEDSAGGPSARLYLPASVTRSLASMAAPAFGATGTNVVTLLSGAGAAIWWSAGGFRAALDRLFDPLAWLVSLGLGLCSLLLHELGHAAALTAAGGVPGEIGLRLGAGIGAYADVTDAQRLPRAARVRVGLAGVRAELAFAAALALAFAIGRSPTLALAAAAVACGSLTLLLHTRGSDGEWLERDLAPRRSDTPAEQALGRARVARLRAIVALAATGIGGALLAGIVPRAAHTLRVGTAVERLLALLALTLGALLAHRAVLAVVRALPGEFGRGARRVAEALARVPFRIRTWLAVRLDALRGPAATDAEARALLPVMLSASFRSKPRRALRALADRAMVDLYRTELDHRAIAHGAGCHEVRNAEPLVALQREGRGALVCALHMGPFFYAASAIAEQGMDLALFAAEAQRERFERDFRDESRRRGCDVRILAAGQARGALQALRALEDGVHTLVFMDGLLNAGGWRNAASRRVDVEFAGHHWFMRLGAIQLAQRAGAPIVLASTVRDAFARRVVVFSDPMPPPGPGAEAAAEALRRAYAWFEPFVREAASQWSGWLWPMLHWRELGGSPTVTREAYERELVRVREHFDDRRARLVADDTRVGFWKNGDEIMIVHGPSRRALKGSPMARRLITAGYRRAAISTLPRAMGLAPDALVPEIARLTLAQLATLEVR